MEQHIIIKFKQHNKKDFYQWLMISALHPENQRYIIRYEFLIHLLLSVPEEEFSNKPFNRDSFNNFIQWFEDNYAKSFITMEDWQPFNQTKLIPIFINKRKYYFFYGASERPYESIKQFQDILFTNEIKELSEIGKEFFFSLELQTIILQELVENPQSYITSDSMYIPIIEFYETFLPFLIVEAINTKYLHNSNSSYQMGINNFNGLYTEIEGTFFVVPPQFHIEALYQSTETLIYDKKPIETLPLINEGFALRCKMLIFRFFGIGQMLDGLIDPILKSNAAEYFDEIARVDANKIILFKLIPHSSGDLSEEINKTAYRSREELHKIQANPYLGLQYVDEEMEESHIVPSNVLEFTIIIVFEKLTLNYMLGFEENWKENDIFIFNSIDLRPILELVREKDTDTYIFLLQYLEAEKKHSMQNSLFPKMDELDSFVSYYKNDTFLISGQEVSLFFVPHEWSDFYNTYLFEKYQDNIYELIEMRHPNRFNIVEHMSGDTYSLLDTALLDGGRCIKYDNKLIWVMYPTGMSSTKIEYRTYLFLGEFISYYLDEYKNEFFKFLHKFGFDIENEEFALGVYPDSYIERHEGLKHLTPYTQHLSSDVIRFLTRKPFKKNGLHTFIIYSADMDSLERVFSLKKGPDAEKEIFKDFVISVLKYLGVEGCEHIAEEFIHANWHLKGRAFTFDTRYVKNPKLEHYKNPKQIQESFIANVNQEVVSYLKELNITPKEYWANDAKQLNNLIFEFLQRRLEEEVSKLNSSILYYAYTEIEYIEGKRETDESQAGLDASKHVDFDIQEKFNQQRIMTSHLAIASKHILHTVLKVNPKGAKAPVDSDWYRLLAFSTIINESIQRSDQLHYGISETGIEITDIYEMIDIDRSSVIDFDAYFQKTTSSKILASKTRVPREQKPKQNDKPKRTPMYDESLNAIWKDVYGFELDNMLTVTGNLGRFDLDSSDHFPLTLLSFDEINAVIQEHIVEPPAKDELKQILDFLSINFTSYNGYKYIDYSIDRLMKKKERLNLSPFIRLGDRYLFGCQLLMQSAEAWFFALQDGDIPFSISDNSPIKDELKRIHRELDLELEDKAYEVAKDVLGRDYVEKNILNFKRLSKNFPKLPPCGEIDLLVANINTKTIFVMDAKNVNKKLFNSAIKRELRDFFHGRSKKASYLDKLNSKVNFIEEHLEDILTHFKIVDKGNWTVCKGFVVNTLYFSAYYEEKIDFILVDELGAYLQNEFPTQKEVLVKVNNK